MVDIASGRVDTINIPSNTRMISVAGHTDIGANQVTQVIAPASNVNGVRIYSFYTQVIQPTGNGNIAQSLVLAAATAPVDFADKLNCFPIYRTFQDDKQSPIALGGFAPMNIVQIEIPVGWGVWQIVNITNAALARNNMRFGIVYL